MYIFFSLISFILFYYYYFFSPSLCFPLSLSPSARYLEGRLNLFDLGFRLISALIAQPFSPRRTGIWKKVDQGAVQCLRGGFVRLLERPASGRLIQFTSTASRERARFLILADHFRGGQGNHRIGQSGARHAPDSEGRK
ncbi:hypothetical protein M752DRAFT_74825 [Aspergillus phoenicis ATCC 13157]|uniref:Uncharacterized protein n=1 Tax=Aspergillus phoenicis ATCC 13157 TaxID=1353007 RepID=A0A370P9N4_ASPPH|nr:hypothetical protein M752DRAFT_74825 [Aspergillus phoenicis ATCC 13157]